MSGNRRLKLLNTCLEHCGRVPQRCDMVAWLFLRGVGLVYLAAFASMAVQVEGLIGSAGILPLADAAPAQKTS